MSLSAALHHSIIPGRMTKNNHPLATDVSFQIMHWLLTSET